MIRRIQNRIIPLPLSACILKEEKKNAGAARIAGAAWNVAANGTDEPGSARKIFRKDANVRIEEAGTIGEGSKTAERATGGSSD